MGYAMYRRDPLRLLPRLVYRFCERWGWWPSTGDLMRTAERGRILTWRKYVHIVEREGLIERVGRFRWRVTAKGFAMLGEPAIVAKRAPRLWCNRFEGGAPTKTRGRVAAWKVLERGPVELWAGSEIRVVD